jgi:hypothetical protein
MYLIVSQRRRCSCARTIVAACPTLPISTLQYGAAQLSDALPEGTQGHFRSILTDEYLRVIGSEGTIYAMGDGATIYQVRCGHEK